MELSLGFWHCENTPFHHPWYTWLASNDKWKLQVASSSTNSTALEQICQILTHLSQLGGSAMLQAALGRNAVNSACCIFLLGRYGRNLIPKVLYHSDASKSCHKLFALDFKSSNWLSQLNKLSRSLVESWELGKMRRGCMNRTFGFLNRTFWFLNRDFLVSEAGEPTSILRKPVIIRKPKTILR